MADWILLWREWNNEWTTVVPSAILIYHPGIMLWLCREYIVGGYGKWDRFLFFRLANLNVSQGHCPERDKDKRVVFWCSTFPQFFVFFLLCIGRLFPRKWNRLFVVHFFLLRWTTFNWQISHQLLSWDAKRSKTNEYKWGHINHKIITGPLFPFLLRILAGFSFLSRACYSLCQGWSALPCSSSREPWTLRTINIISMATH